MRVAVRPGRSRPCRWGVDPLSGIDFVRITYPGYAPWRGTTPPTQGDDAIGRGGVDYEYFIGRYEVTTSQWVQFFNAAYDRPAGQPNLPWLTPPTFWGAQGTKPINKSNPNARRWQVPAGNEVLPVGNISWRMAAMYCNFLQSGGAGAAGPGGVVPRENFLSGAYDVSTFGPNGMGGFGDQPTRSPGRGTSSRRGMNGSRQPTTTRTATGRTRAGTGSSPTRPIRGFPAARRA